MAKKIALITGGSRGIGWVTAETLRQQEWRVIAPRRHELDLSMYQEIDSFADELDALIMCGSQWYSHHLTEQYSRHLVEQYILNVVSHYELLHLHLAALSKRRGCVVVVSSTRGLIGGVETAPYSMAKAAQIALVQGFAREYPGVRFNCVCPGLTATRMEEQVRESGGCKPDAVAQSPQAVAQVIVDLVNDPNANGLVV